MYQKKTQDLSHARVRIIGQARFKAIPDRILNSLIDQSIFRTLQQPQWELSSRLYANQQHLAKVLKHIDQSTCMIFSIRSFNQFTFTMINHIHFHTLQQIDLTNCFITSLENIASLEMPFLQKLVLRRNPITNLKGLNKITLRYLKKIQLGSRELVINDSLHLLWIQWYRFDLMLDYCCVNNLSNFAKIQNRYFQVTGDHRSIYQEKIHRILMKKNTMHQWSIPLNRPIDLDLDLDLDNFFFIMENDNDEYQF